MPENIRESALALLKKHWLMIPLILIILVALWYRIGVISSYVIPTYGNTMYHVGIERETIVTGYYPTTELSYGGGFPNFYVPAYRLLIASMSAVTGIDPMVMSGLMTITLAIFILLCMFAVAYRLSDNAYIGLFAAFFFILSPELTIFTIRPLPELLGLFMVPFTLYFVIQKNWPMVVLGAVITALTHQMTLLVLVAVIGLYMLLQLVRAAWIFYKTKSKEQYMKPLTTALWCLVPIVEACLTYAAWLMYSTGSVNILGIAQVKNHEGNTVDAPLFLRTGVFVLIFFFIGLATVIYDWWDSRKTKAAPADTATTPDNGAKERGYNISVDSALLIISWVVSTMLLTFNDKLFYLFPDHKFFIFPNFMDRYFTFFVQIAIIVAAFGMYALLSALDLGVLKEKPQP